MNIFFTADLHLNHTNIIIHQHRPFADVMGMNEDIVANWNSRVSPADSVFVLGDVGKYANEYIKRLKGRKFLVPGNHDRLKKDELHKIFDILPEIYVLKLAGAPDLVLSHYPMLEWPGYFRGALHLFGHVHGTRNNQIDPRSLDVGVDNNNFKPYSLNEVLLKINKKVLDSKL